MKPTLLQNSAGGKGKDEFSLPILYSLTVDLVTTIVHKVSWRVVQYINTAVCVVQRWPLFVSIQDNGLNGE